MRKIYNQYSNVVAYRSGEEPALFKALSSHDARKERLLREIKTAKTDKKRKAKTKMFFRSFSVCQIAVILAAQKRNEYYTPEEIDDLARSISKSHNFSEPIRVSLRDKNADNKRIICRAGIKRHAIQIMVQSVLEILEIGHRHDYILNGGRDRAISDLLASTNKNKYPVVLTSDNKDFYGSIEHSEVRKLLHLFPKDVVEFCVLNNKRHKIHYTGSPYNKDDHSQLRRKVQRGIPQG